ncbi:unnamed protein product [Cuscuta europaea]|uniref:Retrotransposon gag domain-containing protein n=1 Tax=Cuscuta europaea TaxID=41803 RepID=A0A9P0YZ01_CUSEU|nr:unnamed protein product [Cuscuta europaea]
MSSSTSIFSTTATTAQPPSTAAATSVTTVGAPTSFGSLPAITSVSSGVTFSSNFASPSRVSMPYSLFQNVPSVFPWSAPILVQAVPLEPPPFSAGPSFVDPTFVGSPGVSSVIPPSRTPAGNLTGSLLTDLAQTISHVATNVTNIVTTKLLAVEDYTTWRTQFESFLVSQALLGMVDGSIQVPPAYSIDALNRQIPNPEFSTWLRIDQTIHSWLFATLSRDVLIDVRDLKHSCEIWEQLESRFMSASLARSMELKRFFNQIKKKPDQSMDNYLREIKILVDDLATINCPVPPREVLKTTIMGLGPEYESLFTTVSQFLQNFPFETLRNHLLELEQQVIYLRSQESPSFHQAFGAAVSSPAQPSAPKHSSSSYPVGQQGHPVGHQRQSDNQQRGRGRCHGRVRGGRGRGRGQQQVVYWYPQGQ